MIKVVAFVLTIILSTISLGKYFNKTKINVNSGVAIPIIKLEGEQKIRFFIRQLIDQSALPA